MKTPKFKVGDNVKMEGRSDELIISEVDVSPCSCSSHERHEDDEIYYSINDWFNVKESEITKV
ncbi:hypothetical protein ACFQ2T_04925 [Methylophilus flavus]|uniref:DUF2158 domain-containing protein n=1 Tax=Methylophilus flavus TaxID=640084 RepID=A0ABW3PD08_9PROT